MEEKWPPFIEFMIWFVLMGVNVGNHFGVWLVSKSHIVDVTESSFCNATYFNNSYLQADNSTLFRNEIQCVNLTYVFDVNETIEKIFLATPEEQWKDLLDFRIFSLSASCIGALLFFIHIGVLLPNIIQSCRVPDPLVLKESDSKYFSNLLKMHCVLLILETILFDIPVGCVTMELLTCIWAGPTETISDPTKMEASKMILALSLIGLAFIALYKGMMPLFLWIGNPFCFPCIPLRLLVVFPGGLIALVMTFAPVMGVAKNRLLLVVPGDYMQAEIGELANTFFSIGMIFWGVFLIITAMTSCCWYKFCREGATADVCSLFC